MQHKKLTLSFKRNTQKTTKSADFEGIITFMIDEVGIVYDFEINFNKLTLVPETQPTIWNQNSNIRKIRDVLFKELKDVKIIQKIREKRTNNPIKISTDDLKIVNNFFNDRTKYNSTILNIIGILTGTNPSGSFKDFTKVQMICPDPAASSLKYFVKLIDAVYVRGITYDEDIEILEITPTEFLATEKNSGRIGEIYNFFIKDRSKMSSIEIAREFEQMENMCEKYIGYYPDIKDESVKRRQLYRVKLSSNKEYEMSAFDKMDENEIYHKCHIKEVKDIVVEAMQARMTGKEWKAILDQIDETNNFIPLPASLHDKFDRRWFTYDKNGELVWLDDTKKKYYDDVIQKAFPYASKINKEFLKGKEKYLKYRNNQNL